MASKSQRGVHKQLISNIIEVLSAPKRPDHYTQTFDKFCAFCQEKSSKKQLEILHELINNKLFINSIIKHFKKFDNQIINIKKSSKKPANYTFNNFIEIANKNIEIAETEERIENCLTVLINISEIKDLEEIRGQIHVIFGRANNNLFQILSSILNHCKLYRLYFSNKIFRFLQQMLPPINTRKSKIFCDQFNIPILLDRCCEFMIYRMHIDGDGDIDKNKEFDYNDLYGLKYELPAFVDSIISIVTYLISSKWHKKYVLNDKKITSCIATLCIRLCHEVQSKFDLKPWSSLDNIMEHREECLCNILNSMQSSFKNGIYNGHVLVICVAMEYLYYYSLKSDINLVAIPLGDHTYESFESSWHEYQYVVALIRRVTNNKILGLYVDTIANKLGYNVNVEDDVKNKKKKDLTCHWLYCQNTISCFYSKCKKKLDIKNKDKLKKCASCQAAFYCDKKCQKKDWKHHRKICNNDGDDGDDGNEEKKIDDDDIVCFNEDCINKDNLKRCTGCYDVWYCSVNCQTENWKLHKKYCKEKRKQQKGK